MNLDFLLFLCLFSFWGFGAVSSQPLYFWNVPSPPPDWFSYFDLQLLLDATQARVTCLFWCKLGLSRIVVVEHFSPGPFLRMTICPGPPWKWHHWGVWAFWTEVPLCSKRKVWIAARVLYSKMAAPNFLWPPWNEVMIHQGDPNPHFENHWSR